MLIVVGILVVLLGVGFVALMNHMRNLHQKEMDGQAKEIFVAAQNHLSMAYSQGYLGKIAFTDVDGVETSTGDFGTAEDAEKGIFYFITTGVSAFGSDTVLDQMLPVASVDETARTGGSYIIRYQKEPARVLDVFYVSTSGRYSHTFSSDEYNLMMELRDKGSESHRNERNKYDFPPTADGVKGDQGVVIGYYGGELAAEIPNGFELEAPIVEIENNERLKIKVTNTNKKLSDAPSGESNTEKYQNTLTLVIAHTNESQPVTIKLIDNGTPLESLAKYDLKYDSTKDQFTLTLDDITAKNMHFAEVMGENYTPGENILVFASASNTNVWTNVADSGRQITNSLFASRSGDTVHIANFRHFMNLDSTVSGLTLTNMVAEQDGDMSWYDAENDKSFLTKTGAKGVILKEEDSLATAEYCLYPISHDNLTYHGNGHVISDVKVNTSGAAGLFRALDFSTVSNVELLNFDVESTGSHAGALAGSATSSDISGVLVRNDPLKEKENELEITASGSSGSVGGMVGHMTNGSVEMCAAAVYVNSTGSAGGLIGTVVSSVLEDTEPSERKTVSIKNSYSGGHTNELEYTELTSGTNAGRINVIAAKKAGGLIGDSSDAKLNLDYCYSTSSASGDEATGGLIGVAGAGQVRHSYAVGLVINGGSGDSMKRGAFVGDKGSLDLLDTGENPQQTNAYLEGLSAEASQGSAIALAKASTDADEANQLFSASPQPAMTYDAKLASRFSFRTIKELHDYFEGTSSTFVANYFTETHYGDWQLPTMEILHYTLNNEDQLYSDIILGISSEVTIAVYGENSGHGRVYHLTLNDTHTDVTAQVAYPLDGEVFNYADTAKMTLSLPYTVNTEYNEDNTVKSNTLRVYLDDITTNNGHFAQLFAGNSNSAYNLKPGENITLLVAGGKCSWSELQSLLTKTYPDDMADSGKIIALSDNSLFAKNTAIAEKEDETNGKSYADSSEYKSLLAKMANGKDPEDTDYMSAEIKLFRHLQNLDNSTSDVSGVTGATLLFERKITVDGVQKTEKCLNWSDVSSKYPQVYNVGGTKPVSGGFVGIYNEQLQKLEGNNRTIEGLPVKAAPDGYGDSGTGIGNVGFFRYLGSGKSLTVKELHLKDLNFEEATTGYAGAFVAQSLGTLSLEHSLAEAKADYEVNGKSAAGGLVGLSSGNLTIQNSAASMLITSAGPAGGLVGKQTGNTTLIITDSYVGGHTYNGMYYPTVDDNIESDDNGVNTNGKRWNIISSGGEAGGLVGCLNTNTTAKIARSFNTATVFGSTAGGIIGQASGSFAAVSGSQILDLVYTIAPVYNVTQLAYDETNGFTATVGNSGSVFGQISGLAAFDSSKLFFLPDTFSKPIALEISNGATDEDEIVSYTSITPIGNFSGEDELLNDDENLKTIFENIHLASYYRRTTGNDIIGTNSATQLEQETTVFDNSLMGEYYPFAIWTTFNFDGSEARHFYGDWQPVESRNTIQLHVHLVYVKPASADGSSARVVSVEEQKQSIQIPYDAENAPAAILLPYLPEYFGFDYGNWQKYYGDYSAGYKTCVTDTTASLPDTSSYTAGDTFTVNTGSVNLSATDFNTLYSNSYTGTDGKEHVHLTLVSNYKEKDYKVYKLQLFDHDPPSGDYSEYGGYKVLELTDDKKADDGKWYFKSLVDVKDFDLINKKIDGKYYRVSGWYLGSGEDEKRVVKFVYQDTDTTDGKNYEYVPQWDIANFEVTGNIELYAKYEEVVTCSLTIRFVDGNKNEISGLKSYSIPFEAEQGFHQTLTLPGDPADTRTDKLWPDLSKDWSVTPNTYAGETTSRFFERNTYDATNLFQTNDLQLQVNIPPVSRETSLTDAEKKIVYTVVYRGAEEAVKTGFAVVYELMHTKYENGTLKYSDSDSDSYVYDFHLGKNGSTNLPDYLFGLTNEGEYPNTELMDENGKTLEAKLGEYLTDTLQSEGFEPVITFVPIDLENANSVPEKYRGKYAAKVTKDGKFVTTSATDDLDVTYLVVVQGYRKKFPIVYDTRGGNIIKAATEAEKQYFNVEYGASIGFMVNKAAEGAASTIPNVLQPVYPKASGSNVPIYNFDYWYQTVKENDKDVDKAILATDTMPAHNLTVYAHRTGNPVSYTVAFWYENAENEDSSFVTSFTVVPSTASQPEKDKAYIVAQQNDTAYFKKAGDSISAEDFMAVFETSNKRRFRDNSRDDTHFEYNDLSIQLSNLKNTGSRIEGDVEVRADGNTVLNIVLSRKDWHVIFYLNDGHHWDKQTTIDTSETYYGLVNGDYVQLSNPVSLGDDAWYAQYEFEQTTENNENVQYFGLNNGEYALVAPIENYVFTVYDGSPYDSSKYYCLSNTGDGGTRVRYSRRNHWVEYDSHGSNTYYDSVTKYIRTTEYAWKYITKYDGTSNGTYIIQLAGKFVQQQLYYKSTGKNQGWYRTHNSNGDWRDKYEGVVYTAGATATSHYKQVNGVNTFDPLHRNGTSAPYTYTDYTSGDAYGEDGNVGDDGVRHGHVPLEKRQGYSWTYTTTRNSETTVHTDYTGDVYQWVSGGSGWETYHYWSGKYKSTFESNGYSWSGISQAPANKTYAWHYGSPSGGTQTYQEAFTQDANLYELWGYESSGNYKIIHYRQGLTDNDWTSVTPVEVPMSDHYNGFTFENKFDQFTVAKYESYDGTDYYGRPYLYYSTTVSPGYSTNYDLSFNPLKIYHTRNSYKIVFMNGPSDPDPKVVNVKYGTPFDPNKANAFNTSNLPANPTKHPNAENANDQNYAGFNFRGWSLDATMQEKSPVIWDANKNYNANAPVTSMPAGAAAGSNALVLYAKWTRDAHNVTFDATTVESWAAGKAPELEFTAEKGKAIAYGATLPITDVSAYVPEREGYTFEGWVYTDTNGQEVGFMLLTPITENLALRPKWTAKQSVTVWVKHVTEATEDEAETLLGWEPVDVYVGDFHKFNGSNDFSGWIANPRSVKVLIDSAWLNSSSNIYSDADDTEHNGKPFVKMTYMKEKSQMEYKVKYYLSLKTMAGEETFIEIPSLEREEKPATKFAVEQFYELPEGLKGYTVTEIGVYEGNTLKTSTNDPVVFIQKSAADNIEIRVKVAVAGNFLSAQSKHISYNRNTRNITDEDVLPGLPGLLPKPPVISGVTTRTEYTYNDSTTAPSKAGVYDVRIRQIINIGGTDYVFWDSRDQNPGLVALYIDRREIILKSQTVDNAFRDTQTNREYVATWNETHEKLKLIIDEDGVVETSTIDTSETTEWATLKDWVDVFFTVEAFRSNYSSGVDDYSPNTFEYFLKDGVDEDSVNVYKVTGKLYLWKDQASYEKYNPPAG